MFIDANSVTKDSGRDKQQLATYRFVELFSMARKFGGYKHLLGGAIM